MYGKRTLEVSPAFWEGKEKHSFALTSCLLVLILLSHMALRDSVFFPRGRMFLDRERARTRGSYSYSLLLHRHPVGLIVPMENSS